jgi:hypothetical protein
MSRNKLLANDSQLAAGEDVSAFMGGTSSFSPSGPDVKCNLFPWANEPFRLWSASLPPRIGEP